MEDLPAGDTAPESKTVSYLNGQIKIVIEWDVPEYSTLKNRTEGVASKPTVVGSSSWNVLLYPLDNIDMPDHERAGNVYVNHECLTMDLSDIKATYKISVVDANNKRHLQIEDTDTFKPPDEMRGVDLTFKHIDIWGPKPSLLLKDDTLKLIVEISYDSVKQTHHDLFRPLEQKLQVFYDATEDDITLVSSDGNESEMNRRILIASSPVFRSMLKSNMIESKTGRCEVADVCGKTINLMVQYMLYNNRNNLAESARDVLVAADKYQMDDLKCVSEKVLVSQLTDKTAAELLILADRVSALILKTATLRYVAANLQTMTASNHLKELTDSGDGKLFGEVLAAVARHGSETTANSVKKAAEKPRKRKTADQPVIFFDF